MKFVSLARTSAFAALAVIVCQAAPAPGGIEIGYNPVSKIVQGSTAPRETYGLTITGPTAATPTNPVTATLVFEVLAATTSAADALSFIWVSDNVGNRASSDIRFTSATEPVTTWITVSVPLGTQAGDFQWKIKGSNWSTSVLDAGATVNATVMAAEPGQVAPAITTQPISVTVNAGASATLQVSATGTPAPTYQWLKNLEPIAGATSATLTIAAVTEQDVGTYSVVATNPAGSVTSNPATISLDTLPAPPAPPTVVANFPLGGNITLPAGQSTTSVPFQFVSTPAAGLRINTVVVTLNTISVASSTLPYLPTLQPAITAGILSSLPVGQYTLTATATTINVGGQASGSASVSFKILPAPPVPPQPACGTAIVNHAAELHSNAGVDGSLQILLPEDMTLAGNVWISKDLLVPGSPALRVHGNPIVGGTANGSGIDTPTTHTITLDGRAALGRLVTRTNPVAMGQVLPWSPATGTRDIMLNSPVDVAGAFDGSVRDVALVGNVGAVVLPAGTYRDIRVDGGAELVLGAAGAQTPAVYHLRRLTVRGTKRISVRGPVVINVLEDVSLAVDAGEALQPKWLAVNVANGGFTLDGTITFHGTVLAPKGTVTLNGNAVLRGGVQSDRLVLRGNSLLDMCSAR